MFSGDNKNMNRCLRIDIVKGYNLVILVHNITRNITGYDLTKEAVTHICILRDSNNVVRDLNSKVLMGYNVGICSLKFKEIFLDVSRLLFIEHEKG